LVTGRIRSVMDINKQVIAVIV